MSRLTVLAVASLLACLWFIAPSAADDAAVETAEAAAVSEAVPPETLAAQIDELIARQWAEHDVEPAPIADDAEFLRRTWLNIAGRIPPASEVRRFLADTSPDKRRQVVEELLQSPAYYSHFARTFRQVMLPGVDADFQRRFMVPTFETWLRDRLVENTSYDEIVRDLITTPVTAGNNNSGQAVFYAAKEYKPENLGAAASRVFLGVRLECAQCHDHPFADWKQKEFWQFAAFFAGITGNESSRPADIAMRRSLTIPETETVVEAQLLGNGPMEWSSDKAPREALGDWITDASNPYFAPAAVNRMWAHFFGIGIVDPVDDFDDSNPPSHPEVLEQLAREFVAHNYDLKYLVRAITATRAYQRTSRQTHENQDDPRLFARMTVKGLTPDQVFDSLAQATGFYEPAPTQPNVINNNSVRSQLQELFQNESSNPIEMQTSILQALQLMNGSFVAEATMPGRSSTLAAVIDSPFLNTTERVETLYLAALSRMPRDDELSQMVQYVQTAGTEDKSGETPPSSASSTPSESLAPDAVSLASAQATALGDVFWALLNSSEFLLNH